MGGLELVPWIIVSNVTGEKCFGSSYEVHEMLSKFHYSIFLTALMLGYTIGDEIIAAAGTWIALQ